MNSNQIPPTGARNYYTFNDYSHSYNLHLRRPGTYDINVNFAQQGHGIPAPQFPPTYQQHQPWPGSPSLQSQTGNANWSMAGHSDSQSSTLMDQVQPSFAASTPNTSFLTAPSGPAPKSFGSPLSVATPQCHGAWYYINGAWYYWFGR